MIDGPYPPNNHATRTHQAASSRECFLSHSVTGTKNSHDQTIVAMKKLSTARRLGGESVAGAITGNRTTSTSGGSGPTGRR
jgi:hypothetical protein